MSQSQSCSLERFQAVQTSSLPPSEMIQLCHAGPCLRPVNHNSPCLRASPQPFFARCQSLQPRLAGEQQEIGLPAPGSAVGAVGWAAVTARARQLCCSSIVGRPDSPALYRAQPSAGTKSAGGCLTASQEA